MSDVPGSVSPPTAVADYYDRLSLWTRLARPFGYGGGSGQLTVHRLLTDPAAGGAPTATRIHDVIAEALPRLSRPRILDAGCGLGGTMLDLARRFEGSAVGLTLSEAQRERAARAIDAQGMRGRADARVQSYDAPPPGPFDLVVAIESLAHSADPGRSVEALIQVLAPGGRMVVVDDMPAAAAVGTDDLRRFMQGWQAPVVWSRERYVEAFRRAGLTIAVDRDLSHEQRLRTLPQIARLEVLNRAARMISPARWRVVLDSYRGGLALERLHRRGMMTYRMLVAYKEAR